VEKKWLERKRERKRDIETARESEKERKPEVAGQLYHHTTAHNSNVYMRFHHLW